MADPVYSLDQPPGGPVARPDQLEKPQASAYNQQQDRETKRGQIALRLLAILAWLTAAPFVLILLRGLCYRGLGDAAATDAAADFCRGFPDIELMELLQLVFAPIIALVGAATGFYFGEKKE